jgi:hypothetical protein
MLLGCLVALGLVASWTSQKNETSLTNLSSEASSDLSHLFTFEINRHGARIPWWQNPKIVDGFKEPYFEMLTPMGMRQRYLLGRYNRLEFNPKTSLNMHVESTDYYRTIQSGYSELSGMVDLKFPDLNKKQMGRL